MAKIRTVPVRTRSRWRNLSGALRPAGAVAIGVSAAIALSAVVGGVWDWLLPSPSIPSGGVLAVLSASVISAVLGSALYYLGRAPEGEEHHLSRREALLAVALIWLGAGITGALPYVLGARMGPADAFFESVSGLTTTGATVITDIELRLSRPLLLWRSMSQWLGGMGIVVLFVAVFPSLGAGAKHLYRGEAPGAVVEGFKPRIAETSITLWKLYAALTVAEMILLVVLGMDPFEAVCHALTTMSTGGFSTRDASVGGFGSAPYEWVIAIFMLLGSVNYGLYYAALRYRSVSAVFRNTEFRAYVVLVLVSILALTALNWHLHPGFFESLRYATFMVATSVSSTGYGTDDYTVYSPMALAIVVGIMFIGGCSGSTAGGIKVERIVIMAKQTLAQVRRSFDPSVIQVVRMGRAVIPKPILADVTSFFVIFMLMMGVGTFFVSAVDGVPLPTSFGAMLTSLSNMGPSPFHELAGFSDNFAAYSSVSKVFFVVAMLLGRLEFFTLFALLFPGFWRR